MEKSKFFNSAPGDPRVHYASDFAEYFGDVLSSGLLHTDKVPALQAVIPGTDLRTIVKPGKAIIHGYAYENTSDLELTHGLPEATLDRIDRIVLRLDKRNQSRFIRLFIKQGDANANPVPPVLQRDEFIHELSLAQVRVRANTSTLMPADLKDERLNEQLCGLVYSLISIPTTQFQEQWDLWFNTKTPGYEKQWNDWFGGVQNQGFASQIDFNAHKADYISHPGYAVAGGTDNAYTVALTPAPTAYKEGMALSVKINADSTGPSTINVNGLGAKGIKKSNGVDVTNLKANGIYTLRYDGTNFILQGEGGSGNAIASDLLLGKTASTDAGEIVGTMPNRGVFNLGFGANVPAGYYSGGSVPAGKKFASGTFILPPAPASSKSNYLFDGIPFKPKYIYLRGPDDGAYNVISVNGIENMTNEIHLWQRNYNANTTLRIENFVVTSNGFSFTYYFNTTNMGYSWMATD